MLEDLPEDIDSDEARIDSSGLFDRDWYMASHPAAHDGQDPLAHFCRDGWRRGFKPNPYFDPAWYSKTYATEFLRDENPLLHFIRRGERENAWPSPHFDPEWYRSQHALGDGESPLRHYLVNLHRGTLAPLPTFDAVAYTAARPESCATGADPYLHWLSHGDPAPGVEWTLATVLDLLGNDPTNGNIPDIVTCDALKRVLRLFAPLIPFDEASYCRRYLDVAEALQKGIIPSAHWHFIQHGFLEGRSPGSAPRG